MIATPRGAGRVVAGFDGSWHAHAAVDRAVEEARERALPLQVVSLAQPVNAPDLVPRAQRERERADLEQAARALADVVTRARQRREAPRVWGTLVDEAELSRLGDLLLGCRLLVLGDRGRRGRRAFVVGSASDLLWRATDCPVLVVPGGSAPGHPTRSTGHGLVVAGVDDRPVARDVLAVAADEAARRGGRLEVVHAYAAGRGRDADEVVAAARRTVEHQVATARLRPDVVVTRVVTCEDPAAALLGRADRAALVVVGTRGPLGLAGLVTGSVSRGVLAGASCPVLLVPADGRGEGDQRVGRDPARAAEDTGRSTPSEPAGAP